MSDRHFYAGVSRRRLIQGAATMGLLAGFDSCYRPMLEDNWTTRMHFTPCVMALTFTT